MKKLIVRVKEIRGCCESHHVGDCFRLEGGKLSLPGNNKHICIYAFSSLLPLLPAKERNPNEPDDWLPRTWEVECPDPNGGVIWEISYAE